MADTPTPGAAPSASGPSTQPVGRPQAPTKTAATTITQATSELATVIDSLRRTLKILSGDFTKVINNTKDVVDSTKLQTKTIERLNKISADNVKSLTALTSAVKKSSLTLDDVEKSNRKFSNNTSKLADAIESYTDDFSASSTEHIDRLNQHNKQLEESRALERQIEIDRRKLSIESMGSLAQGLAAAQTRLQDISAAAQAAAAETEAKQKQLADLQTKTDTASVAAKQRLQDELEKLAQRQISLNNESYDLQVVSANRQVILNEKIASATEAQGADVVGALTTLGQGTLDLLGITDGHIANASKFADAQLKEMAAKEQLDAFAKQNSITLAINIHDLAGKVKLSEQALQSAAVEIRKTEDQLKAAQLAGDVAAETAARTQLTAQGAKLAGLQGKLAENTKNHAAAQSVLTSRNTLLSTALDGAKSKLLGFASGVELGRLALEMWTDALESSRTGIANSLSELFSNYGKALFSGISSGVYQDVLRSTKTSQLTSKNQAEFNDALGQSTSKLFEYTGSRDMAAKVSAELMQAMSKVGVSGRAAAAGIDKLTPVMGVMSRITGKSTEELAKFASQLYTDNDFRLTSLGMNEQQKALHAANILAMENELVLKGYTLEQARQINKENAQARLSSDISSRLTDRAKLMQSLGMVVQGLEAQGKGGEAGEFRARQARIAEINKQLDRSDISVQQRGQLEAERKQLGIEAQKLIAQASNTLGESSPLRAWLESAGKSLESMTSIKVSKENIPTGAVIAPEQAAAAKAAGGTGMFTGALGTVASTFDYIKNSAMNPLILGPLMIASIVAANKITKYGLGETLKGAWEATKKAPGKIAQGGKTVASAGKGVATAAGTAGKKIAGAAATSGSAGLAALRTAAPLATAGNLLKGGIVGAGVGLAGDYAAGKLRETGYDKTAAGVDIASSAASFAAMGALLGPLGAGAGAAAGGIYGLYKNWGTLMGPASTTAPLPTPTTPIGSYAGTTQQPPIQAPQTPSTRAAGPLGGALPNETSERESLSSVDILSRILEQITKLTTLESSLAPEQHELIKKQLELMDDASTGSKLKRLDSSFPLAGKIG